MADAGHAADRLLDRIARAGAPICVGLDPVAEKLPASLRPAPGDAAAAEAVERFSIGVLDAVRGIAPAVKVQAACFERHGPAGAASRVQRSLDRRGVAMIAAHEESVAERHRLLG